MGTIRKIERAKGVVYEAVVRIKGAPARSKSFEKKKDAAAWIAETETKINKGGSVSSSTIENTTIQNALQAYLDHHSTTDEDGKITYTKINQKKAYNCGVLQLHLGEFTIKTLTHDLIEKFIQRLLDTDVPPPANRKIIHKLYAGGTPRKYSGATVRRYYFDLKTAIEWWAFKSKFELGDRFERHDLPKNWTPRDRRLEKGEEERLLKACEAMLKAPRQWQQLIQLALETAMRPSELLGLVWVYVHTETSKRFIAVVETTNKMRMVRQVPLSKNALAVLKEMRTVETQNHDRVFNLIPHQEFSACFKKITTRAGLKNFRAHDLRHEALSRFFEKNLNLSMLEIASIAGHTQLSTLQRYVNLRPALLADKLDEATST